MTIIAVDIILRDGLSVIQGSLAPQRPSLNTASPLSRVKNNHGYKQIILISADEDEEFASPCDALDRGEERN